MSGIVLRAERLKERIVQRAEIGVDLALQITGEKAEALARLHGRARQNDAVDLLGAQRLDRHGNGEEGFTRAGRADAEHHGVLLDGVHILLLPDGLCLNRLAAVCDADAAVVKGGEFILAAVGDHSDDIVHCLLAELFPAAELCFHKLDGAVRLLHIRLGNALDDDGVPLGALLLLVEDANLKARLQLFDIAVERAENHRGRIRAVGIDDFTRHDIPFSGRAER